MTQPNIQEDTKQKLQRFYWPLWFPYPSSWLKALILNLFLSFIIFVLTNPGKAGYRIAYYIYNTVTAISNFYNFFYSSLLTLTH